jgi:hypothetical protein
MPWMLRGFLGQIVETQKLDDINGNSPHCGYSKEEIVMQMGVHRRLHRSRNCTQAANIQVDGWLLRRPESVPTGVEQVTTWPKGSYTSWQQSTQLMKTSTCEVVEVSWLVVLLKRSPWIRARILAKLVSSTWENAMHRDGA